jgi:hypothetical protein
MNELIKELANEAGFIASAPTLSPTLEKFAQLIIAAGISAALSEIVEDDHIATERDVLLKSYLKGNNSGIVDAIAAIKQHFGIEDV